MFFHFDQAVDFDQIVRYVTVRAKGQNFEIEPTPELKAILGCPISPNQAMYNRGGDLVFVPKTTAQER